MVNTPLQLTQLHIVCTGQNLLATHTCTHANFTQNLRYTVCVHKKLKYQILLFIHKYFMHTHICWTKMLYMPLCYPHTHAQYRVHTDVLYTTSLINTVHTHCYCTPHAHLHVLYTTYQAHKHIV